MNWQRRSTPQIIGRVTLAVIAVLSVHVGARLLFSWGVLRKGEYWYRDGFYDLVVLYASNDRFYEIPPYDPSFWGMKPEMTIGGWSGYIGLHFFSGVMIGLLVLITVGIFKVVQWLIFEPKPEPELDFCKDPSCKCIEHSDMVFNPEKGYWDYPSGGSGLSTGAIVAASAATTAAVAATVTVT